MTISASAQRFAKLEESIYLENARRALNVGTGSETSINQRRGSCNAPRAAEPRSILASSAEGSSDRARFRPPRPNNNLGGHHERRWRMVSISQLAGAARAWRAC